MICYNRDILGHLPKDCRKPKKETTQKSQVNAMEKLLRKTKKSTTRNKYKDIKPVSNQKLIF